MSKIHEKSDCFACVIASHGEEMELETENNIHIKEHVIVGTDGRVVKTRDIVEMFNADNCEELKDKPKFFFIQACRTSNATVLGMDSGLAVTITERKQLQGGIVDGIEDMQVDFQIIDKVDANCISTNANSLCENNLDTRHLSSAERYLSRHQLVHQVTDVECPDDTLLMFASLSSNYAVRNPTNGGWLLTSLYSQIKEHIDTGKICSTEFTQILNGALKEMTTKIFKPSDITSRLYGAFSPGCLTHSDSLFFFYENGGLPPTLYIQADNSPKDNKNKYLIMFLAMLVKMEIVKKIKLTFLMVGHTHEDVDQLFSRISVKASKEKTTTIPSLLDLIKRSYTLQPIAKHVESLYNFRDQMAFPSSLAGNKSQHVFKLTKDGDKVFLAMKEWPLESAPYKTMELTNILQNLEIPRKVEPNMEKIGGIIQLMRRDLPKWVQNGKLEKMNFGGLTTYLPSRRQDALHQRLLCHKI
ncbi:unnamed protein product [Mytilus coruscus]|uniref:CASP8 n=1 Tax=Mytilus coruscus TaxID=42192 RepID=A0A6J8EET1_MYTCO|nr:unnamed protein product [Mytilus coruscus]